MEVAGGKPAVMLALALMLLIAVAGCGAEGSITDLQTARESVEPGTATTASVHIDMASGQLNLSEGSTKLMDATFQYNVPTWKPQVTYNVKGTQGVLSIVQPVDRNNLPAPSGNTVYDWDIRLSDQVPVDLGLRLGLGKATLNLSNLKLTNLDMQLGAGNVEADLSGSYDTDVHARITGGVGNLTLKLDDNMAARATVTGNLGKVTALGLTKDGDSYTNDALSPYKLTVEIESGIGEITLDGR